MPATTAYEAELERIDGAIGELRELAGHGTLNNEQNTKLAYKLYQRASLTGRLDEFAIAESAIQEALQRAEEWPDLWLVQANLHFKFHRLAETKNALEAAPGLAHSLPARVLAADIAFQEGQYGAARTAYEQLIEEERTWDNVARLAYWESKFGEEAEAEQLYGQAEDEITAKEMRGYCWVQLQRGLLDLRRGRFAEAERHYRRADQAYSGYWLVADHLAELYGARGNWAEAIELYEGVLARTPRPELQQAFGELYQATGETAQAERWFDRALAGYLESAAAGGVHYYHHLVDFYSDVRQDGAQAVAGAARIWNCGAISAPRPLWRGRIIVTATLAKPCSGWIAHWRPECGMRTYSRRRRGSVRRRAGWNKATNWRDARSK